MPILHMQTEQVRTTGNQLLQASRFLAQQGQAINNSVNVLAGQWLGSSRDIFLSDIGILLRQLAQLTEAGSDLNLRLQREVDEWEQNDANFGNGAGIVAVELLGGTILGASYAISPEFDMVKGGKGAGYELIDGKAFLSGGGDSNDIDPNDVSQGQLGDCYFIASLAAIARQNPDLIREMIRDNGDGTYTITFHEQKEFWEFWKPEFEKVEITVDGQFPAMNGSPVFAQPGDYQNGQKELWPMLIEKAYAQWQGDYGIIEGGWTHNAFEILTGQPSETYSPGSLTIEQLAQFNQNGHAIGLESLSDNQIGPVDIPDPSDNNPLYQNDILVANHSYYLTGVDTENGTVTFRNPWGWDQGEIIITFDEFMTAFQKVSVNQS